jgi:hypothetical protein
VPGPELLPGGEGGLELAAGRRMHSGDARRSGVFPASPALICYKETQIF